MPLLNLFLSKKPDDVKSEKILSELSQIIAECLGKPHSYMMVSISESKIFISGSTESAAFADLRSIGGINPNSTKLLSKKICDYLYKQLGTEPDRIYCNFSDVAASNWGWNGSTFG
ncbi:MAG TPA: phenylpyruvate tautomerase MIF-related protein [Chitinispirillaceae bacterium]|nr:phenylpyruvate tautomerase MIF-related protein [Chitinispirillaceae bacterium]